MNSLEVKRWRRNQGLTQAQLAERLGVSVRLVNGWECGTQVSQPRMLHLAIRGLESVLAYERYCEKARKDGQTHSDSDRQFKAELN